MKKNIFAPLLLVPFALAACLDEGDNAPEDTSGRVVEELIISNWANVVSSRDVTWVTGDVMIYNFPWPSTETGPGMEQDYDLLAADWSITLPRLKRIGGHLKVIGVWIGYDEMVSGESFHSLSFPVLEQLDGDLRLRNLYLVDRINFPALSHVGGTLWLGGLNDLNLADGFRALSSVGRSLMIRGCEFTSLHGLERLTDIPGSLILNFNESLTSYAGLANVRTIGYGDREPFADQEFEDPFVTLAETKKGYLEIFDDGGVQELGELAVTSVAGSVILGRNSGSQIGLHRLETIGDTLKIYNWRISSLKGFKSLKNLSNLELSSGLLRDFQGLESITKLKSVSLLESGLVSFYGLHNVTEITDKLTSTGDLMADFSGLQSLQTLGGIGLYYSDAPTSFAGLEHLQQIGTEGISILNSGIETFEGLNSVQRIRGSLKVQHHGTWDSPHYISLDGLENLRAVDGDFVFTDNEWISDFSRLGNLTTVGGTFHVEEMIGFRWLSGLSSLTEVGGDFELIRNFEMMGIRDLDQLSHIGGKMVILDNTKLCASEIRILQNETRPQTAELAGNRDC